MLFTTCKFQAVCQAYILLASIKREILPCLIYVNLFVLRSIADSVYATKVSGSPSRKFLRFKFKVSENVSSTVKIFAIKAFSLRNIRLQLLMSISYAMGS